MDEKTARSTVIEFQNFPSEGCKECEEEHIDLNTSADLHADPCPIPDCGGVDRDNWTGKALLAWDADGLNFAEIIIITTNPNACVDGCSRFGIVVLEVLKGDANVEDTCLRWPMHQLFYHRETGYVSVYDHARKPEALDKEEEASRNRMGKRPYHYDKRSRAAPFEDNKIRIFSRDAIGDVFMQSCCGEQCTFKFHPAIISSLRTKMHLQSFQVKSSKILDVHRSVHKISPQGKEVVTLQEKRVLCDRLKYDWVS